MDKLATTLKIRRKAHSLGFDACGFARAEKLDREAVRLESWLNNGQHGTMQWMENHFDKRVDPTRLVPGAKSVISVLGSYHFERNLEYDRHSGVPKIAKYARGRDYHKVFKKKLFKLFGSIKKDIGDVNGRVFVDSAPVMDKVWAERAGLGWIGKNSNLLNKEFGSFFLIGEMILDLECVYDGPVTDHCGTCTKCMDACPTNAIHEPYRIDSNRCISYLTIELKDRIPEEIQQEMGEWMFGCDICQDVCPWNSKAKKGQIQDLRPRDKMFIRDPDFWEKITEQQYEDLFNGTPVRRAKYPKFKDNAEFVACNMKSESIKREKSIPYPF
ncbi:MAG: tRNA epoxyqueuosine(34) reductase QueG [Balneolaceae bacterium]